MYTYVCRCAIWSGSKSANPRLAKVFDDVADDKQAAFIPYLTAGYPKRTDTVDLLLALQVNMRDARGKRGGRERERKRDSDLRSLLLL